MNRLHHHPLTGSLSAPSSPSTLKSSIPLKMSRHATTAAASGIRPPAPNIIVEKGRIEFVKTEPMPTTTTTQPSNEKHGNNKLVMGTKIFRPPAPKKCESSPTHSGGSISFRDRSASPKFNARESTPPLPESKIPSSRIKQQPDVVNSRNIPRPGLIKSRETSPAGASQTTGPLGSTSNNIQPVQQVQQPAKSIPSAKNATGISIPVPVSPNLIRWRAKLSGSSGPSVTSHLNNVASGNNNSNNSPSSNPTNPGAGSQKKSTGSTGPTSPNKTSGTLANNKATGDKPSPSNVQQQQQQQQQVRIFLLFRWSFFQ